MNVDLSESNLPSEVAGKKTIALRWTGSITSAETEDCLLGVRGTGFGRLSIDGKQVATLIAYDEVEAATGRVHLVKGQKAELSLHYGSRPQAPRAQLIWAKVNDAPSPEAMTAARNADVIIAVVGITSRLEGEEMPVTVPGFQGGDRTSIDLPEPEEALVEAVAATGKPMAVILLNGSALAVNRISGHANAVLESWYPGEEGGAAVAETLSGRINPAGRLPVTFYTGVNQLPNFEDYGMANRTYRYFNDKPLYPFGYGLSYITFRYSDLSIPTQAVTAGEPVPANVTVTNTGKVAGEEVVQVYLKFPAVKGAPITKVIPSHADAPVHLRLTHLATNASYHLEVHRTGFRANDAYTAYIELGSPRELTEAEIAHLRNLRFVPRRRRHYRYHSPDEQQRCCPAEAGL